MSAKNSAIVENGLPTSIIIAGSFDCACLASPTLPFNLHCTMRCGNVVLNLTVAPILEPSSFFLPSPGLAST